MRRPSPHLTITLAVLAVAAVLLAISPYAVLVMAPALALAWLVAVGAFTGEEAVRWVRRVVARLQAKRPRPLVAARRAAPWVQPRGGLLMAAALASRPPPGI